MKQDQFETVISLKRVFLFPRTKRIKKALNAIRAFALKHEKNANVLISTDVNRFLHARSKNIPRKIDAILVRRKENLTVYLKDSKQLEEDKKRIEKEEKEKAKEKAKKETAKKAEEAKEETDEEKKKLEAKRQKEKVARSIEAKTGRK